jgi:hypothetical protein
VRYTYEIYVSKKNAIIRDVTLYGSFKNRRFGGAHRVLHQGAKISELGTALAVNVSSSLILSTLMIKTLCTPESSVLTRTTRRHIPEDGILHSHRFENLKPYMSLTNINFLLI